MNLLAALYSAHPPRHSRSAAAGNMHMSAGAGATLGGGEAAPQNGFGISESCTIQCWNHMKYHFKLHVQQIYK